MAKPAPPEVAARALGPAFTDRLAAIAARHSLDSEQTDRLTRLLANLQRDPRSPTTVRDPVAAIDVHLADSLAALDLEAVRGARSACDLGSGAGFPGLPLAVALPHCHVHLIESAQRKCAFLQRAATSAGIDNADVVCARAEQWPAGLGRQDAALARALAPPAVVAEYAAPLLRLGGVLVDWRGSRNDAEEERATRAAHALGLERAEVRRVRPFAAARHRYLHLYVKVRDTPDSFPRRPGIARKRPLGGSG